MPSRVVPTLAFMADVYGRSAAGGPSSPRFRAYAAAGAERRPVHGYNPMTSQDVLSTIEALLAIDAERVVAEATSAVAGERDLELFVTVATPGMWTERFATEVHHRLGPPSGQVLLWTGDDPSVEAVRREAVAQAVRLVAPTPRTVTATVAREGLAYASAGMTGAVDPLVADALEIVGGDEGLGTTAALLYGDAVATHLGWTPLGLGPLAGYHHAIAVAVGPA